ncbi:hypothetical protein MPSEU_000479900 [Mayamaea pseudoterrestris]|nr:hypothetical protein MPSEU_000479900 [Mayamaea pseudoterrestris]
MSLNLAVAFAMAYTLYTALALTFTPSRSTFTGASIVCGNTNKRTLPYLPVGRSAMIMRDISASYWFQVGDSVRVVEDVFKAEHNLKGRVGIVRETWEKCDVDPTCCCAEQVDINMAVRVMLESSGKDGGDALEHHFAEAELVKIS